MRRFVNCLGISLIIVTALVPAPALAARPQHEAPIGQVVELRYLNEGPGSRSGPGEVTPQNTVYGACGWASFYVNPDGGGGYARLEAAAGTSHPFPIVYADYTVSWHNNLAGTAGSVTGQTYQFSWTWASDHRRYTSTGWVYGQLTRLFVRHSDGTACVGLMPSDTTWIQ